MKVFIDTNVLLDVLMDREPFVKASQKIWELAEEKKFRVFVSAISFSNIFYIIRKANGLNSATRALQNLKILFIPAVVDERIIHRAIDGGFDDFEDAIQYYSALRERSDFLLTRNLDDFPKTSQLSILTPEVFLAAHKF